jgi:hypothetical protein
MLNLINIYIRCNKYITTTKNNISHLNFTVHMNDYIITALLNGHKMFSLFYFIFFRLVFMLFHFFFARNSLASGIGRSPPRQCNPITCLVSDAGIDGSYCYLIFTKLLRRIRLKKYQINHENPGGPFCILNLQ